MMNARAQVPSLLLVSTLLACGSQRATGGPADASTTGEDGGQGSGQGLTDGGSTSTDGSSSDGGASLTDASGWQSRGVGGGGALFVPEISPFDDQIYMATDMGGVFHSADFGQSWTTLDFRLLAGGNVQQVRFTSEASTLFAIGVDSSGDNALVTSTNGGATFTQLGAGTVSPYYIEVDPTGTQRLVYTDSVALYFSGDGGTTFSSVYTGANTTTGLLLSGSFWSGQNIYLGTSDGVVTSTNGGSTFSLAAYTGIASGQSIVSFAGAAAGTTTRFFAVTNATSAISPGVEACDIVGTFGGVYTLDVGQSAWTSVSAGLPAGDQPTFVRMALNDIDTVYLAGSRSASGSPAVDKSTNAGAAWAGVLQTANNANIATGWAGAGGDQNWGFGGCAEGFAVSRVDSTRAVLTDMGFVHVTSDGATTWSQAYVTPSDENPAGASTPKGKAYQTAGVEQTSVWWLTWADPSTLFASFTDITSVRSTTRGATWMRESQNGLTENTTYQAVVAASGTMYAATSSIHDMYMSYRLADAQLDTGTGSVMQSSDEGATWTTVHAFGYPVLFLALDPTSADSLYATVENSTAGGVFHTTNLSSGASSTWTQLANPPRTQGHPYNIRVLGDGTLVVTYSGRRDSTGAFTSSSGVFVSTNQGAAWTDVSDPNMDYWTKDLVIDPNDTTQSTWYVGVFKPFGAGVSGVENGLFRTTDRGQHWAQIWTGYNVESCSVDPNDANHLFVSTDSAGLWATTNLSAATPTFTADPDYPFAHPLRVFFNPSDSSEAWATSFGGGLRVREL